MPACSKVFALGAVLSGVPSLLGAAQITNVGMWKILSGTGSSGPYCTMQQGSAATKVVGIQVSAGGKAFLSIGDPAWTYTPQQMLSAKITIDGTYLYEGNAIVVIPTALVIPLPKRVDAVTALGGGKILVATIGGKQVKYDLAGVEAARDALKRCLAKSGER